MSFPNFPQPGKNSKVQVSSSDGNILSFAAMTRQALYSHRGEQHVNTVYLLGAGKTLINIRPAVAPKIIIDGILDGLEITPTATNNEVNVSGGFIEVDGDTETVSAEDLTLTRPALDKWAQYTIVVNGSTQAVTAIKGTDTATDDEGELLDTYGTDAGQRAFVPVGSLLIGFVRLFSNVNALVSAAAIGYEDRERGGLDYELLPNIGGARLQSPLALVHTGGLARPVRFSGYYYDAVLADVGTAKSWSLDANSSQIDDETFNNTYSFSQVQGFNFSFDQLAADRKVIDATWYKQGYCAVRLVMPNGFAWQSVATVVPNINSDAGSMISISVTGSCADFPEES